MAVALFKAQLNAAGFRRGEIVDVDPDEYARLIEKGWLKPYAEGEVLAAPGSSAAGEPETTEYASSSAPDTAVGDASPST